MQYCHLLLLPLTDCNAPRPGAGSSEEEKQEEEEERRRRREHKIARKAGKLVGKASRKVAEEALCSCLCGRCACSRQMVMLLGIIFLASCAVAGGITGAYFGGYAAGKETVSCSSVAASERPC